MQKQILILSLIFIFSAGLFAGDAGDRKKSNGKSAAAGKANKSGNRNTEGAAADGVSFVNVNGDTLLQVREDGIVKADTLLADSVNVDGTVSATAFVGDGAGLTGLPASPWLLNGSAAYYNGGKVGIGTSAPAHSLSVSGGNALLDSTTVDVSELALVTRNSTNVSGRANGIGFSQSNGASNIGAAIIHEKVGSGGTSVGALHFATKPSDGQGADIPIQMTISEDGNVGIGTTAPNEQLEITGNLRLPLTSPTSGIIYAADTLLIHTHGNGNFFAGKNAGNLTHTDANYNTGIGQDALSGMVEGDNNTAVGTEALKTNTSGGGNTAVGGLALKLNNNGSGNTAIGWYSMIQNTDGILNTAIGSAALGNNITGNRNTIIGALAIVAADGLENATAIGFEAVVDASHKIRLGNDDITLVETAGTVSAAGFVGDGSGLTGISGDNLGNHTATQALNLNGNFLSGDGDSEGVLVDNDGNVLISRTGATENGATLTIEGRRNSGGSAAASLDFKNSDPDGLDLSYTAAAIRAHNGGNSDDGDLRFFTASDTILTEWMRITHNGLVGIGTANPAEELEVDGSVAAEFFIGDGSLLTGTGDDLGNHTASQALNLNGKHLSGDGDNEGVFVDADGNVGIGTTTPKRNLQVTNSGDALIGGNTVDISEIPVFIENPQGGGFSTGIGFGNSTSSGNVGAAIIHENTGPFSNGKLHFATKFGQGNRSDIPVHMTLDETGNVGIGTTDPIRAKVEIQGHAGVLPLNFGWLNNTGNTGTSSNGNGQYSLYASDRIAADEFNAFSDERIKNIIGRSDNAQDLSTLLAVEITDYTMIDTVAKGRQSQKKVIAQQVKDVFPQAVSTLTDVVPDIYQLSEIADGWVQLATDLQVGEKVKLIRKDSNDIYAVQAVRDDAFRVDLAENGEIFVYGREVDDFHTVDYEAIAMLNVSATQALYQRIQQQQAAMNAQEKKMNAQQEEIAALKEKVAKVDMLENQLAAIMEQLASANTVRSAMLIDKADAQ